MIMGGTIPEIYEKIMNIHYNYFNLSFIKILRMIFILVFVAGCGFCEILAQDNPIVETKNDTVNQISHPLPSPKGAMIRSILLPGWGQWYNDKKIKAGIVFLAETGIIGSAVYWGKKANNETDTLYRDFYIDNRNLAFWYLGGFILLSMADAFVDAPLSGFDVSPELGMFPGDQRVKIVLKYSFTF